MIRLTVALDTEMHDSGVDHSSVSIIIYRANRGMSHRLGLEETWYSITCVKIRDMTAAPREFLEYVDAHKDAFVKRLANAIAIPR
jgi:hypothetical protein